LMVTVRRQRAEGVDSYAQYADMCILLARTSAWAQAPGSHFDDRRHAKLRHRVRSLRQMNGDSEFSSLFHRRACPALENIVGAEAGVEMAVALLMYERATLTFQRGCNLALPGRVDAFRSRASRRDRGSVVAQRAATPHRVRRCGSPRFRHLTRQLSGEPPGRARSSCSGRMCQRMLEIAVDRGPLRPAHERGRTCTRRGALAALVSLLARPNHRGRYLGNSTGDHRAACSGPAEGPLKKTGSR
jgi:hypothetical protein